MSKSLVFTTLFAAAGLALVAMPTSAETWNLADDFSLTNNNGTGAWAYGYVDQASGNAFTLYDQSTSFYQSPGGWNQPLPYWGNGNWSDGGMVAKNTSSTAFIWTAWNKDPNYWYVEPGAVSLASGKNRSHLAAVRWTANFTGTIDLSATAIMSGKGGPQAMAVVKNSTILSNELVDGFAGSGPDYTNRTGNWTKTFTSSIDVNVGDNIYFVHDLNYQTGYGWATNWGTNSWENRNVSLSATIVSQPTPEPGSMLALGSGLIGLLGFAVRRRK